VSVKIYGLKHWGVSHAFATREEAEAFRDQNPLEVHSADGVREERYEVVELDTPQLVACRTCEKEIVTAKDPVAFPYCKSCYYNGTAHEDLLAGPISGIQEAFPGYWCGVWHTGGGCMGLVIQKADEAYQDGAEYYMLTDPSLSGVDHIVDEGVGIICRYKDTEDAIHQAAVYCDEQNPIGLSAAIALIKKDMAEPMDFEVV